ncbi:prolipoprotein diacylglyceryl transferase [Patescibacteria group bacterium AH-259-L07]|nr:prolipoprotein diacylglyceryl transferase [Patescibacteria group bacterium AH-259-L07]
MWIFNFLHTFHPQPILFRMGPVAIHWYGLLIVIGMLAAWLVISYLVKNIKSEVGPPILGHIEKVVVYGVIYGLIGARLYHVFSELPYYIEHPLQMFMIWRGGLGIFGALVGGALAFYWYCRKHKLSFLLLADIFAPGIIIAQAMGRWGNYFNSELFGLPTEVSWGIPIALVYRPAAFMNYEYFHPTFLYESLWNIAVFIILFLVFKQIYKKQRPEYGGRTSVISVMRYPGAVFAVYLILYSFGRSLIEFIRIDPQPEFFGLRLAQIVAIGAFIAGWTIIIKSKIKNQNDKSKCKI